MKKLNSINSLNNRSQKKFKNLSNPQIDENLKTIRYNKNLFPTLNSLYPIETNNYNLNNKNLALKRSSTEDFKKTKIFSETVNTKYLEEQSNENNEKQEQKENNNKIKISENKKYKNKKKSEKKKKYFNKKEQNKYQSDYYPNNINIEDLMNIITVKEAKELKKRKNYLKNRSKPKLKKFENIEIVRPNNEVNIEPILKIFSNVDFIHEFDEKIGPITNKRFKDLEIIQESEEKLNLNAIKKFGDMEIIQNEKDFHIIDIKNINYIKSDTISENFSGENIQEKLLSAIEIKHIDNLKYNSINNKRFKKLEIMKEIENFSIEANLNKKESILNLEENKEDDNNNINNNNNTERRLSINNMDFNNKEDSNQVSHNEIIEHDNNINQSENGVNNNKNTFDDSKDNSNDKKNLSNIDNEEFLSNQQGQFNHIYLKDIKTNIINSNQRKNEYSQINNQYDSDSRNNNFSNIQKIIDKSSIEPIKNDSQNYSKLIEGVKNGEFNIYSNDNNISNNQNEISIKGNKNVTDVKEKDKNCFTFKEGKSNNSSIIKNGRINSK